MSGYPCCPCCKTAQHQENSGGLPHDTYMICESCGFLFSLRGMLAVTSRPGGGLPKLSQEVFDSLVKSLYIIHANLHNSGYMIVHLAEPKWRRQLVSRIRMADFEHLERIVVACGSSGNYVSVHSYENDDIAFTLNDELDQVSDRLSLAKWAALVLGVVAGLGWIGVYLLAIQ